MTESEICELEDATGCQLPVSYRDVLLHYPERLAVLSEEYEDSESAGLFRWKASLIRVNVDEAEYINSIFPVHYFVIGESGCGDYYAVDTGHADAPVYIGGPHEGEYPTDADENPLPINDSIRSYVDDVVAIEDELAIEYENDRVNDRVYVPPSKLSGFVSLCIGALFIPILILWLPLSILLSVLMRLWTAVARAAPVDLPGSRRD